MKDFGSKKRYIYPLVVLSTLFFMWGFITCLNDILIPYLKDVFALNHFESQLVQLAFFVSYFIVALAYFLVSATLGDPILKIGYKNTISLGLIISAIACFFLFLESSSERPTFALFLLSLALLGMGFSFLQIAANPLVSVLGSPETSSSRLNMVQAFNSLGTTLAPIIGGYVIFNLLYSDAAPDTVAAPSAVQIPFLFLSSVLLVLSGVLFFAEIPSVVPENGEQALSRVGALRHPYLITGMIGIFCYVGAEVTIGSNLVNYMRDYSGYPDQVASAFLSFYWGGALIGRLVGSFSMGELHGRLKNLLMLISSLLCLALVFGAFSLSLQLDWQAMLAFFQGTEVYYFFGALAVNFLLFLLVGSHPSRTLGLFAVVNIALLLLMLLTDGGLSLWAVLSVGLFNSIMFSNIFTLAIDGLGKYTTQGSSLLVMMILGGAVLPPLQGLLADYLGDLHYSFALPILCYIYLVWYGFFGSGVGRREKKVRVNEQKQENININEKTYCK